MAMMYRPDKFLFVQDPGRFGIGYGCTNLPTSSFTCVRGGSLCSAWYLSGMATALLTMAVTMTSLCMGWTIAVVTMMARRMVFVIGESGNTSFLQPEGTVLMEAICDVFKKHSFNMELEELMSQVSQKVRSKEDIEIWCNKYKCKLKVKQVCEW
ncbi:unnamed protein product, partial [Meganyctiphanes norvegica]